MITRARTRTRPDALVEIAVAEGVILAVDESTGYTAEVEIDAGGNLVTETFVNPHLHLDKVYTLQRLDDQALTYYHSDSMGKAMTAIELAARVKEDYDRKWILPNVRSALVEALRHGNTHIRAFTDIDNKAKLEGVHSLLEAKDDFAGLIEIQVVAFPQDGVIREPGAAKLVEEAIKLGADVVGGIPWIEYSDADSQAHIEAMFDIATRYDRDVSMLVDDAGDPGLRTLEMLALQAIEKGWEGRVLAHHARAMALYPKPYFQKLAALLHRAEIGLVTDPHTGPLHARVRELLEENVLVCLGQDDISDAYYPYGRNNMLEVAFLASHLLWMTGEADMETLYDMITTDAARAMRLENYGLLVGGEADLVVLNAPNVLEAFRAHAAPEYVISHGKPITEDLLAGLA